MVWRLTFDPDLGPENNGVTFDPDLVKCNKWDVNGQIFFKQFVQQKWLQNENGSHFRAMIQCVWPENNGATFDLWPWPGSVQ